MKKTLLLLVLLSALSTFTFAQLNMTLVGQRAYNTDLSDIWGYVAPDGTEYAIVGVLNGTSIVSLADPANPQEVAFIPGQNSIWRDIKTYGEFAYVTTDQPGTTEGLLVIDLSDLPNSAGAYNWTPDLPGLGTLTTCHNLYIDENGYCYLAGCNLNGGGMIILDVFSQPGTPLYVNRAPANYAHDVYTRDNRMYASEISLGRLGIYDVTDKSNITLLATQDTPFDFTHNAWLSDDGSVVFTTDERANAPVAAYDISDLSNIQKLDEFRPIATLGENVIPHNVHVWNDYLIISYYTDGGIVVDASRPDNLIEVGNFDTFFGGNGGFSGAWGAYPFLPSGLVLISDINNGLFVLEPNYVRAAWLEGTVTDAQTGLPLNDVTVQILSAQPNLAATDPGGDYQTGQALAGVFPVRFQKVGYETQTVDATLQNGQLTVLDVALNPLASFNVTGFTVQDENGQPVPHAEILLFNDLVSFQATSGADGLFTIPNVFADTYQGFAAAWGYYSEPADYTIDSNDELVITLQRGYRDNFALDLGWTTESVDATSGFWVREKPIGTSFGGQIANPGEDVPDDFGDECYVTGNGGGSGGTDDVDNGTVTLISPPMDLTGFEDPVLSYRAWFFNAGGNAPVDDAFTVTVTNGITTVTLEEITESGSAWRPATAFHLADLIEITDNMRVIFETGDPQPNGHIVEAAVDDFRVTGNMTTSTGERTPEALRLTAFPNPFGQTVQIRYPAQAGPGVLYLFSATGQLVRQVRTDGPQSELLLGADLAPGLYFARLETGGQLSAPLRLVKMR